MLTLPSAAALQPASSAAQLGLSFGSSNNPGSTLSSQPFMQALSDAIAGTLEKFGIDPNSVTLNLDTAVRQNVDSSQIPVLAAPTSATPALSAKATDSRIGLNALVPLDATPSIPGGSFSASASHFYASDPVDDLYWNKQPPAVRQLREIDDLSERQALGLELANQGYQVDVPVMIWGWDAGKTADLRKSFGYTWVPSELQQPPSEAPGLAVPGLTPYDAAHPPQGSILV